MRWPGIESLYGPSLRQSPIFASGSQLGKKTGVRAEGKKAEEIDNPGELRWEALHKRVVEHVCLDLIAFCNMNSGACTSGRKPAPPFL
jgi:26S proteasome regulatory subunit N5